MDPAIVSSLSELVATTAEVAEAHLPQCYIPDLMAIACQVLVLVIPRSFDVAYMVERIGSGISKLLPLKAHLDIWPDTP